MTGLTDSSWLGDRRQWFRTSAAAGLAFLLPPLSARAAARRGADRPRSLLTVWLQGGPSQLETWDPHLGGPTQAIPTVVPGLKIAEFFPQTAAAMGGLSVVRSLVSKEGDHERGTYHLKTGYRPDPSVRHPSLGSVVAHERPAVGLDLPPHVALTPGQWPPRGGFLGDEFDAFRVSDPGRSLPNTIARVDGERQSRRLAGLSLLDRSFARGRASDDAPRRTIDDALHLMGSEQLRAFSLDDEPAELKAAYGDSPFGRGCLVARRLLEAGVRAVEVTLDGFDSHTSNFETHRERAAILDPALASLLADLTRRDLLASTVVLVLGEFGRTPKLNPLDGRDHWPNGFSCLLGGGGLAAGRVVGATDPAGVAPPTRPVPVADLTATVLAGLGLDPAKELMSPVGRPLKLSDGTPVAELLSV